MLEGGLAVWVLSLSTPLSVTISERSCVENRHVDFSLFLRLLVCCAFWHVCIHDSEMIFLIFFDPRSMFFTHLIGGRFGNVTTNKLKKDTNEKKNLVLLH